MHLFILPTEYNKMTFCMFTYCRKSVPCAFPGILKFHEVYLGEGASESGPSDFQEAGAGSMQGGGASSLEQHIANAREALGVDAYYSRWASLTIWTVWHCPNWDYGCIHLSQVAVTQIWLSALIWNRSDALIPKQRFRNMFSNAIKKLRQVYKVSWWKNLVF